MFIIQLRAAYRTRPRSNQGDKINKVLYLRSPSAGDADRIRRYATELVALAPDVPRSMFCTVAEQISPCLRGGMSSQFPTVSARRSTRQPGLTPCRPPGSQDAKADRQGPQSSDSPRLRPLKHLAPTSLAPFGQSSGIGTERAPSSYIDPLRKTLMYRNDVFYRTTRCAITRAPMIAVPVLLRPNAVRRLRNVRSHATSMKMLAIMRVVSMHTGPSRNRVMIARKWRCVLHTSRRIIVSSVCG
jgi:hypothetical protein